MMMMMVVMVVTRIEYGSVAWTLFSALVHLANKRKGSPICESSH